jgi:hypothetical protein
MKRISAVACVVALVLLASAVASGATTKDRYGGSLQGGVNNAGLGLTAFFKHGDPQYVTGLEWHNVNCGGPYAGKQTWRVDVSGAGKFHKTHDIQDGYDGSTVTFTGEFRHHNDKVVGTISISPTPGCAGGTGTLNYTAK